MKVQKKGVGKVQISLTKPYRSTYFTKATSTIAKKYNKLSNSIHTRTTGYIYKLIRNASECKLPLKHTEAEHLVRSSICYRDVHCKQFMTSFKKLRTTIIATLVKVLELTKEDETHEALLGASVHTASTESYFPESCYHSSALDTHSKSF